MILGNKPLTLEHVDEKPRTFYSRSELRDFMKANDMHHPYFMD